MTTFVVTTSADVADGDVSPGDLSLREAIDLANANFGQDRIAFADVINYIALTDKLPTISDGLRLIGGGDVVLDANADGDRDPLTTAADGNRRALDIRGDGIAVTVDGLTITGGSSTKSGGGGGIRSGGGVDLEIVDCEIVRNVAGYHYGGGVRASGNLTLVRSNIEDNIGFAGGGVWSQGTTRVFHSKIKGNESGSGGGIYSEGRLSLWHSVIVANQAVHTYGGSGGGIFAAGDVNLVDSRVLRNVGSGDYILQGAGICAGSVTARDSVVAGNILGGDGWGGGIYAESVHLFNSEVSNNRVDGYTSASGGGIQADDATIVHSTVRNNIAEGFIANGGGLSVDRASVSDSTIAWNTARSQYHGGGGGIYAGGSTSFRVLLENVTFTGNTVLGDGRGGGIFASPDADLALRNSIVVGNSAEGGRDQISGQARLGKSIVDDDGTSIFAHTTRIAPGIFAGVLGDNGGVTRTVALRPDRDNPAIGGANPDTSTPTDQRGVARDADPDIGAFEARGPGGKALVGTEGPDALLGTDQGDRIRGRGGADVLRGLDGQDDVHGGSDDDTVRGNQGKDVVDGDGGSDAIFGGRNEDILRGGAGPDRFVFFERFGVDGIEDFDARPAGGQDLIDLRHLGISAGSFADRVAITDLGGATLVAVENAGAILCRGVDGEGENVITIADFVILP